jgi:thiol-disulfide isomerase/thioredoxin
MVREINWLLLLPWFVLTVLLAADSAATSPTDERPIAVEHLGLRSLTGDAVLFADSLGPDGRAVCFAFLHPACPLSQAYAPVLDALAEEFAGQGIRFVGVGCEVENLGDVEAYRREFGITFPIHLDTDFTLAAALDATITPEVVLVDRDRVIRYAGRIDDRYRLRGVMTPGDAEPELRNAVEDMLADRPIRVPRTEAVGCPLDRPDRPAPSSVPAEAGVTFHRDVLPFLHTQCQRCHSPNQVGPFSLITYDDAVDWIDIGVEEIDARRMPPAQIESDLDFRVVKPPTAAEVAMLRAWVATGKPEGNPAEAPKLEPFPDYSAFQEDLGPPDIVLEQTEPTQIGAHGNDVYRNIIFPLNRGEDLRLRAIQFLPGNRKLVHHALVGHLPRETVEEAVRDHGGREGFDHPDDRAGGFQDPHGIGFRVPPVRDDGQPRASFVGGFVPGVRAVAAPADAALVIPVGCDIVVQAHYVRTGKRETDSSRIGIWLEKQPPRKVTTMIYLSGDFAVVPAGVADFRVTGTYTLPEDADMVGVIPHAHQLARWVEIRAHVPGQEKPLLLLRVPQWDYNWQSPYNLVKPMRFPAGTRFEAECSYDNSTINPRNPFDPPRDVWHNETIHDEMLLPMFAFVCEKPLDPKGDTFKKFYSSVVRSRFLRRLVDHRFKYVADPTGVITVSPDYDPNDHRY